MERTKIVIVEAMWASNGLIRISISREDGRKLKKGKSPEGWVTRWADWKSQEAAAAFIKSEMSGPGRDLRIPATAVLGPDMITDVRIDWDQEFPEREKLLAHWVMGS